MIMQPGSWIYCNHVKGNFILRLKSLINWNIIVLQVDILQQWLVVTNTLLCQYHLMLSWLPVSYDAECCITKMPTSSHPYLMLLDKVFGFFVERSQERYFIICAWNEISMLAVSYIRACSWSTVIQEVEWWFVAYIFLDSKLTSLDTVLDTLKQAAIRSLCTVNQKIKWLSF